MRAFPHPVQDPFTLNLTGIIHMYLCIITDRGNMLELKGVTKKFNVLPAVNNVSFTVRTYNRRPSLQNPKAQKESRGKRMKNKMFSFFVFITVLFFAVNFFPEKTHADRINQIQQSDDVVVVSNPKTPESKMRILFTEELSIGEAEGDENYMFGNSIAFNTDDEGNFYVADYDSNRILKYDPEGKHLLTFGREGQGPGEFRTLSVPRFDKDNNLYITDAMNQRISFFDQDGNYLRQIRMQDRYSNLFINSKNYFISTKWVISQEASIQKQTSTYGLFDDKFNLVTELYKDEIEIPMPASTDESTIIEYFAKIWSMTAFRPAVRFILADNNFIYLGRPEKYEINIYSPEGKPVKKITRDCDPIPVSDKDKEDFIERMTETLSRTPVFNDDLMKKVSQKTKFPKHKPVYQSFILMENGWLAVIVDSVEDEYTLLDIFDQDGKYIAHFKTPVPAEGLFSLLLFFKNGKAYCVADEDGYKYVKRYSFEIQE
jgi:hypothetical protein